MALCSLLWQFALLLWFCFRFLCSFLPFVALFLCSIHNFFFFFLLLYLSFRRTSVFVVVAILSFLRAFAIVLLEFSSRFAISQRLNHTAFFALCSLAKKEFVRSLSLSIFSLVVFVVDVVILVCIFCLFDTLIQWCWLHFLSLLNFNFSFLFFAKQNRNCTKLAQRCKMKGNRSYDS